MDLLQLLVGKGHPRVLKNLDGSQPLVWIDFQDLLEHSQCLLRYLTRSSPRTVKIDDLSLKFVHVGCSRPERYHTGRNTFCT